MPVTRALQEKNNMQTTHIAVEKPSDDVLHAESSMF